MRESLILLAWIFPLVSSFVPPQPRRVCTVLSLRLPLSIRLLGGSGDQHFSTKNLSSTFPNVHALQGTEGTGSLTSLRPGNQSQHQNPIEGMDTQENGGTKRQREDDIEMVEGPMTEGPTVDRDSAIQGAANSVRQLAVNSQQQALNKITECAESLEIALAASWGCPYIEGPGSQPFIVILKGLLPHILGSPTWREGMNATELIQALEGWQAQSVPKEAAAYLEKFADQHATDVYFQPGPHQGGEAENALFEWCDSAITLLTI